MTKTTKNAGLAGLLGLASLLSLGGCGSGVGIVDQSGSAVVGAAATGSPNTTSTSTQTAVQSNTTLVAANGSLAENIAVTGPCSPGLHCAP